MLIPRLSGVVRGRKEQRPALEVGEVSRPIVDQVVGVDDALVTAEHDLSGRHEREVPRGFVDAVPAAGLVSPRKSVKSGSPRDVQASAQERRSSTRRPGYVGKNGS
jgi:hypothetical protein